MLALVLIVLSADPYAALAAGKPTIPAPLSSLKKGMKEAELFKALKVTRRETCLRVGIRADELCLVPLWDENHRYFRSLLFFPSLAQTRAALTQRWGEPVSYDEAWYWLNPETKLRARLSSVDDPAQLELEPYLPLEDFLGSGPKLPFEHTPIVGSPQAALEKAYGVKCEAQNCPIEFPPAEVDVELLVQADLLDGVVRWFTFDLPARDEARRELAFELLEKKWGRRLRVEGKKDWWRFEKRPGVVAYSFRGALEVRVSK